MLICAFAGVDVENRSEFDIEHDFPSIECLSRHPMNYELYIPLTYAC